jgi:hypothetical protein
VVCLFESGQAAIIPAVSGQTNATAAIADTFGCCCGIQDCWTAQLLRFFTSTCGPDVTLAAKGASDRHGHCGFYPDGPLIASKQVG